MSKETKAGSAETAEDASRKMQAELLVDLPTETFDEDWAASYVHRLGNELVGTTEVRGQSVIDPVLVATGDLRVSFEKTQHLIFQTGRTQFIRRSSTQCIETPEGVLESFESEIQMGPVLAVGKGVRSGKTVAITANTSGQNGKRSLNMPSQVRGLFGMEQTLRRRPIAVGGTRRLPVLVPTIDAVGWLDMKCEHKVSIGSLNGEYQTLFEVDATISSQQQVYESIVLFVDDHGVIQKALNPVNRLETFLVDAEVAKAWREKNDDNQVIVIADGALRDDAKPTQVAFVIVESALAKSAGATETEDETDTVTQALMVPPAACQATRAVSDGLQIMVSSERKFPEGFQRDESIASEADLVSTPLIDFTQPAIQRVANTINDAAAEELVISFARVVKNSLSPDVQAAPRSASQVVGASRGGHLDYSIVLAALLRSREIPTRIAFGLRCLPMHASASEDSQQSERTKMRMTSWVVALVDGGWVSVDPMSGQLNRADQLCLRVATGEEDLEAVAEQVFRRIADIQIKIHGARY